MPKISAAKGIIINDSRGEKTIEVALLSGDIEGKASIPSGKSRGKMEAKTVPVERALENLDRFMRAASGRTFDSMREIDNFLIELDGTEDKRNLGANLTLAVSIAFSRLLSKEKGIPLHELLRNESAVAAPSFPRLFINIINGGLHVNASLNPLPFQEQLIIPKTSSPEGALKSAFSFIESLKGVLSPRGEGDRFGDEGGFVVSGLNPELGLELLDETRRIHDGEVDFGIDAASSSLWNGKDKVYEWRESRWNGDELLEVYKWISERYNLLSIEDPFDEEREEEWRKLMRWLGEKNSGLWVIGDDLTVTSAKKIREMAKVGAANGVIIKPNQRGTVSETIAAADLARQFGWKIIVSHRSGETDDDFIADLAYGIGADGLKAGSPLQQERLVKYKRLIQIEKSLKNESKLE
ncbi:MAG: hypothetical protein M1312_00280 [Patescibacteria group bacterium]|nr:hypothetical protein [Patescibacteria group bacterium]